jgi:PAS domain S-box-containing protein
MTKISETQTKQQTTNNPKRIKWHRVYYLLAFLDVLIVIFGLFINHHLISVQRQSVQDNEVWVNRLDKYLALRKVANKVSKPGDDVFASGNPKLERSNMEQNLYVFNGEFKSVFDSLNDVPDRFREPLKDNLSEIDERVQVMSLQSRKIFDSYAQGDTFKAGAEMAKMDDMLGSVNDSLSELHSKVIRIQNDVLKEESEYLSSVQKYEFITAAFVVFMVLVAVFYGNWIKKRIEEAAIENDKNIKLTAANDFINNVFESMADMMITIDDKGIIVNVNAALLNQLGYQENELIGQPVKILTHEETFFSVDEYTNLLSDKKPTQIEKEFVSKSGKKFKCVVSTAILKEYQTAAVVVAKDISQRIEDERKLLDYSTRLEQSNRELEDFAYVASHDLQEPLRKVQAFGDRLNTKYADKLGEDGTDYIKRMQQASARMQTLINDLLSFSRVSTKAEPFVPVNFKAIAEAVVSDLEVRIEETNGKVEIGDLPEIDADPLLIRQLMQNLIGNALKFHHPEKSPVVKVFLNKAIEDYDGRISLNGRANTENYCQIVVQDNGIGFDEKYLDKIFTVFQRLHGRNDYQGSGVGLAVCRKIVERHNGTITAKSIEGQGAKFIITLPLKQS